MADLPAINTLLHVLIEADNPEQETSFPSRVEDLEGTIVTVAAPIGPDAVAAPAAGTRMQVYWTGAGTRFKVRAAMESKVSGGLPRWRIRALGEPSRDTRRRFVRGGTGSVLVTPACRPGVGPFRGGIVDLSEGGVRCRLLDCDLLEGEPVDLRLTLDQDEIVCPARVHRVYPNQPDEDLSGQVIIVYELLEREARLIRQHVLRWEAETLRWRREQAARRERDWSSV